MEGCILFGRKNKVSLFAFVQFHVNVNKIYKQLIIFHLFNTFLNVRHSFRLRLQRLCPSTSVKNVDITVVVWIHNVVVIIIIIIHCGILHIYTFLHIIQLLQKIKALSNKTRYKRSVKTFNTNVKRRYT